MILASSARLSRREAMKGEGFGASELLPQRAEHAPRLWERLNGSELMIGSQLSLKDVRGLGKRARDLIIQNHPHTIACDVGGIIDPDAETLDALARLQLMTRREGAEIRLRNASSDLLELVVLAGLEEVLPLAP
jgi:ABC-type transporter Mla MlaB component